ncbi:helix-turn-helix domain-containing protein [Pseudomonas schmalbachii]|uniref:Helix-turn-helix domain-containing protein n=1 Tax=Pseudomonas schmalbachii TaxID=2816993 RepID=A0ABS3TTN8_9PSED|nr:helix-turn-helix domain-containing protein [Pseudomonas schmalbachii]MBO3277029.1 helix-turn-helix domain-containing protein [Pseudomonas schmalbachii]
MKKLEPKRIDPEISWKIVKRGLRERRITLMALAQELGLAASTVCSVKYTNYPSIEAAIARRISTVPENIWPDRYPDRAGKIISNSDQESDT